ncbi:reverse transcriptase domain-containing protein [Tanacetum coccineum]
MKEVHYHSWVSNPVMVKKHDDRWRMCVDFKDLNKACPKDGYPLPEIDWKPVDILLFQDAFRPEERRSDLPASSRQSIPKIDWQKFRGVCLDKVEAVLNLQSPKCLKDVQKLNGKLASLNRFLFESAEKSLPFFKTLKKCTKKSDFQWTAEAEAVFKQMKQLIAELPTLTTTMEKEELIMHLVAAQKAVSAVLITEREAKQMPVYFVSRALQVLSRPEVTKRLQKRSIELGEYDIQYRPRISVKGQILVDFIVERLEDDSPNTPMETDEELPDPWTLFMDGSSCVDGSGAG